MCAFGSHSGALLMPLIYIDPWKLCSNVMAAKDGSSTRKSHQVDVPTPHLEGNVIQQAPQNPPYLPPDLPISSSMKFWGCLGMEYRTMQPLGTVPNGVPFLGLIFHLKAICLNKIKYA